MRKLYNPLLLAGALLLASTAPARSASALEKSTVASGSATPSPGGDIGGGPNLLDLEFATGRITVSPKDAISTLTFAPGLAAAKYHYLLSETRIGFSTESDGTFGVGVGWGYNGPRRYLDEHDECSENLDGYQTNLDKHKKEQEAEIDARLEKAVQFACAAIEYCKRHESSDGPMLCANAAVQTKAQCSSSNSDLVRNRAEVIKNKVTVPSADISPQTISYYGPLQNALSWLGSLVTERTVVVSSLYRDATGVANKKRDLCRLKEAYRNRWNMNLIGSARFFSFIDAPAVAPKPSEEDPAPAPRDGNAEVLRSIDLQGVIRYYPMRFGMLQARTGYRWSRTDAQEDTSLERTLLVAFDTGWFIPFRGSEPDDKGFQPGVGIAYSANLYKCLAEGGCETEIKTNDEAYPKTLNLGWRMQHSAFAEVRLMAELQFRLGFDLYVERVQGEIERAEADVDSPTVVRLLPKISAGSSFWGL